MIRLTRPLCLITHKWRNVATFGRWHHETCLRCGDRRIEQYGWNCVIPKMLDGSEPPLTRMTDSRKDLAWLRGDRIDPDWSKATPVGHLLPTRGTTVQKPQPLEPQYMRHV